MEPERRHTRWMHQHPFLTKFHRFRTDDPKTIVSASVRQVELKNLSRLRWVRALASSASQLKTEQGMKPTEEGYQPKVSIWDAFESITLRF